MDSLPIKGSWEDLLGQAKMLAESDNDEAIVIWRKIIDRLSVMPANRLAAAQGSLNAIGREAGHALLGYLAGNEHYDEALAVCEQCLSFYPTAEPWHELRRRQLRLLTMIDRKEAALRLGRQLVAQIDDEDIETLAPFALLCSSLGYHDEAQQATKEMERRIQHQKELSNEEANSNRAYLAWVRSLAALDRSEWDDALAWYQHALTLARAEYEPQVYYLYMTLIRSGQSKKALPFIERDRFATLRRDFWRGLAWRHLGEPDKAQQLWEQAQETVREKDDPVLLNELVLINYYIPGRIPVGLRLALYELQENDATDWLAFFLGGLGWALQNNSNNAHVDLAVAQKKYRTGLRGVRLPFSSWFFCQDLLTPAQQDEYRRYFEDKRVS